MKNHIARAGVIVLFLIPAITFASIDTNLRYGATGTEVQDLQEFLIMRGFLSGTATGNFYSLTRKAVIAYQTSESLPATGFVGPMTRTAINTEMAQSSADSLTPSDPTTSAGDLAGQVAEFFKKVSALGNHSTVASSSPQVSVAATTTAPFAFDPSWRDAVVNLYCLPRYGSINDATSGSGVIIDPRGVILTNAHVASSFIFTEWPNPSLLQCSVRIGSPAAPRYKVALLYIPRAYMLDEINGAYKYNAGDNTVYGQKDYALLVITGPLSTDVTMPKSFPYLTLYQGSALAVSTPVYLSGYPAEYLGASTLQRDLYQLSSPTTVTSQQPIGSSTVPQAIGFSGNISSQHGASGGAVIAPGGQLAGLMTFLNKDYGLTTQDRILYAITTDYILNDFAADQHVSLTNYLNTPDLIALSKQFMTDQGSSYQQMYAKIWKDKGFNVPGIN